MWSELGSFPFVLGIFYGKLYSLGCGRNPLAIGNSDGHCNGYDHDCCGSTAACLLRLRQRLRSRLLRLNGDSVTTSMATATTLMRLNERGHYDVGDSDNFGGGQWVQLQSRIWSRFRSRMLSRFWCRTRFRFHSRIRSKFRPGIRRHTDGSMVC